MVTILRSKKEHNTAKAKTLNQATSVKQQTEVRKLQAHKELAADNIDEIGVKDRFRLAIVAPFDLLQAGPRPQ
jgi:hypothetical protein